MDEIKKILEKLFGRVRGRYETKLRAETISESCKLNDARYCSWYAVNTGTALVYVFGVPLQPGEGINSQSIIQTAPGDLWKEPLDITVTPGGELRLLRTICSEIKER